MFMSSLTGKIFLEMAVNVLRALKKTRIVREPQVTQKKGGATAEMNEEAG